MVRFITVIGLAFAFQSCATIFTGTTQMVRITSHPDSARVEINGISYGNTPLNVNLKRSVHKPMVTISKKGYEIKTIQLQTSFNLVSLVNILVWPGFLIDLATGAIVDYDPAVYNIDLDNK